MRQLNDELDSAYAKERKMRTFPASLGENVDSVRPAYVFAATREKIAEIRRKILTVKHALNVFNLTTVLPGLDLTIDQALVLIPISNFLKGKINEVELIRATQTIGMQLFLERTTPTEFTEEGLRLMGLKDE